MEIPCFVVGDTDVFHVVVNPGKWVSYLKEEIKKKQEPKLNNAAAPDLTLYRVEIEDQVEKSITEQGFIDHLNQLSQNKNKNDALPGGIRYRYILTTLLKGSHTMSLYSLPRVSPLIVEALSLWLMVLIR